MKDFKRPRFGGSGRGGRGGFGGPRREERELFDATCAGCGKHCQVPFRPNGKKPVFCKDCFVRPESDAPRSFDRRDDSRGRDDRAARPAFAAPKTMPDPRIDALKRDIESLSFKMDTVIEMLRREALHTTIQNAMKPAKPTIKTVKPKAKKK